MNDLVIIGTGQPRMELETETLVSGTVVNTTGLSVELSIESGFLNDDVIGKKFISKNYEDQFTHGVIESYDAATKIIVLAGYTNLKPIPGKTFEIKNFVIDLDYCLDIEIRFSPRMSKPFTLYETKERVRKLEGFYATIIFDYEKVIRYRELKKLADIYDADRINNLLVYPHRDNTEIFYKCEIDGEQILSFRQLAAFQGLKGINLVFEGLELVKRLPFDVKVPEQFSLDNLVMNDKQIVDFEAPEIVTMENIIMDDRGIIEDE